MESEKSPHPDSDSEFSLSSGTEEFEKGLVVFQRHHKEKGKNNEALNIPMPVVINITYLGLVSLKVKPKKVKENKEKKADKKRTRWTDGELKFYIEVLTDEENNFAYDTTQAVGNSVRILFFCRHFILTEKSGG